MQSQSILSIQTPVGPSVEIIRHTFVSQSPQPSKRVSLVAGLHGDELEGLYICHRLTQILKNLEEQDALSFKGEINIYPAVNPQALETGTRLWPFFSNDINRMFGRTDTASLPAETSKVILEDLKANSDLVVDIHSSNLHLVELPQIRIIKGFEKKLVPLAKLCNVDLIWVHPHAEIFESTLGYNLNQAQIPTLVIETGICLRINKNHCAQIILGILNLLRKIGALDTDAPQVKIAEPRLVLPEDVNMIQASNAGLFIKQTQVGQSVNEGEKIGDLIDPIQGQVLEEVYSPISGLLFTLREHPITLKGAPLARIATEKLA
jgi:uncharacterized protein